MMNAVQQLTLKMSRKVSGETESFPTHGMQNSHYCDYEFLPPDVPYIVCLPSHEQQQYV